MVLDVLQWQGEHRFHAHCNIWPSHPGHHIQTSLASCLQYRLLWLPCGTLPTGSQPILFVLLRMQVEEVGRTLDLTHEQDRIELVLTLARAYFLAVVMVKSAPRLDERPTLYSTILRGSVGREKDRYTGALISAF